MNFIESLYILSIIFASSYISYQDWKENIIKNKLLLLLISIGVLYSALNFSLVLSNMENLLINIFFAFLTGFVFWLTGFWPAGDAKLFIVFSFLISIYFSSIFSSYLWLDLLVNTFVPLFFFFLVFIFLKSDRNELKKSFKFAFKPYNIFIIIISYLGIVWFILKPLNLLGIPTNFFTSFVILFIVIEIIHKIVSFKMEILYIVLVLARVALDYKNLFSLYFLLELFELIVVFVFFCFFFLRLSFKLNTQKIKLKNLKPGMKVAEGIVKNEKYEKILLIHYTFYDVLKQKTFKFIHNTGEEGLSIKDVKLLNRLRKEKKLDFDSILIHKSIPFAIFLLIGFSITFLINQNLLSFIRYLLTSV